MGWNRTAAGLVLVAVAVTIAFGGLIGGAPAALAQDYGPPQGHLYSPPYLPQGHSYAPGEETLPPINSTQSHFETQVDILQTEIYRRNYEQRMFESEMTRHDLRGGPLLGPNY